MGGGADGGTVQAFYICSKCEIGRGLDNAEPNSEIVELS